MGRASKKPIAIEADGDGLPSQSDWSALDWLGLLRIRVFSKNVCSPHPPKVSKGFFAFVSGAVLAQCAPTDPEADRMATAAMFARNQISSLLKDPYSAQFSYVAAYPNDAEQTGYVFCGIVNSKNGFGAYAGNQMFIAHWNYAMLESMDPEKFRSELMSFCNPDRPSKMVPDFATLGD